VARSSVLSRESAALTLSEYLIGEGYGKEEIPALLLSGRVLINEAVEGRGGRRLQSSDNVRIRPERELRGSQKLSPVLRELGIDLPGRIVLDIGAAHGGFSKVLLEYGPEKIYTIDVSYGQLEFSLRQRPELTVLERHNIMDINRDWFDARDLSADWFIVCDVSFLSLHSILGALSNFRSGLSAPGRWAGLFLLKPQFEASQTTVKGLQPLARVEEIHAELISFLKSKEIYIIKRVPAGIPGKKGNQEFFYYLSWS